MHGSVSALKLTRCAGTALLDRGKLQGALLLFEEASGLVNPKSDAGGRANLQRAITLDSIGRHGEARPLYEQLGRHRCRDVAKAAKSMSFGFVAGALRACAALRPATWKTGVRTCRPHRQSACHASSRWHRECTSCI